MHKSTPLPSDFWLIFPLFFAGMWLAVSFITSQLSSWRSFSDRYPAQTRPTGRAYTAPTYWVGKMPFYRNCVRVVFTDSGVYFYMMFLFRAFHAPFLLPWKNVKRVEKGHGVFGNFYLLEIQDGAIRVRLRLPGKIEHDLARYCKAA